MPCAQRVDQNIVNERVELFLDNGDYRLLEYKIYQHLDSVRNRMYEAKNQLDYLNRLYDGWPIVIADITLFSEICNLFMLMIDRNQLRQAILLHTLSETYGVSLEFRGNSWILIDIMV